MNMLSVILTGMDTSYKAGLLSLFFMGLIYDCYIIKFVNVKIDSIILINKMSDQASF